MKEFEYRCREHGRFTNRISAAHSQCPACGKVCGRFYGSVQVMTSGPSSGFEGWNPVVGEYVANRREFNNLLAQGQDRESRRLGMDVKLAQVDARDTEALNELHGMSDSDRAADLEGTHRAEHDMKVNK